MALNNKQELFVQEYLKCFNATQAAKQAGYSEQTAYSQGSRLLKNAEISARVRERLDESAMEANEVLYHLAEIARGDIENLIDDYGNLDLNKARANIKTRLIKKIRQRTITTTDKDGEGSDIVETEVEMHDRLRALEMIGKHHRLFIERVEVDDWRSEMMDLLKAGKISPDEVMKELGTDLATELFKSAGIRITSG